MPPTKPFISILGAGSWGTALAFRMSARHSVALWARDADFAEKIRLTRESSTYLPGFKLPDSVRVTSQLKEALHPQSWIFVATPIAGIRNVLEHLKPLGNYPIILLSKGIEQNSGLFPHEIARSVMPRATLALLSGPTFANDVAAGHPVAAIMASHRREWLHQAISVLHDSSLRLYPTHDVVGVAVSGAVKNILAIAAGLCDSLELGLSARAALLTRGLSEMARLGAALGAKRDTFMGLAGLGDLLLTATGDQSRNRQVGLRLGRGESLLTILKKLGHVSEGALATATILNLARIKGVDMPITNMVESVLSGNCSAHEALHLLLVRPPRLTE